MRLYISGAGCVSFLGFGLDALRGGLDSDPTFSVEEPAGQPVRVGRVGGITDPDSAASYRRWGQVDTYSRYGYVASRLAIQDAALGDERRPYGVFFGTAYGCMEENQKFDRYQVRDGVLKGASPLVFKGTVDNAPAGWVAVAWKLEGPNATFVSGDGAAAEALWAGARQIQRGRAPGLLCGGVERFVDLHLVLRERDERTQGEVLSEGAGVVLVESDEALAARGRSAGDTHAELVGVHRHRGSLLEGIKATAARFRLDPDDLGLLSLAVPTTEALASARETLGEAARGSDLESVLDGTAVVADKVRLGEFHGAWGGIAVCAALVRRESGAGWSGRPVAIVQVYGEGNESFYVVLREPQDAE